VTIESLLRALVESLRAEGIPFMLTGSVAGAYYGAGRATMDVDVVIDPDAPRLQAFVDRIESTGAYVSADAAREAMTHRTMFNVVDPETGWKADLIIRKARPFSEEEFRRRTSTDFYGVPIDVATIEDLVIAKLEWAKAGESTRQLEDVRVLIRLAETDVDRTYLQGWITALGLEQQWAAVGID
jgi:hypothetical protein